MDRRRTTPLALATALPLVLCATTARAQTPPAAAAAVATVAPPIQPPAPDPRARFAGAFVYAGGARERAGLEAAIERVISQLAFIVAPFARGPLHERNTVFPEIAIRFDPGRIVLVYNNHTWSAPDSGAAVAIRTDFNDAAQLSQRVDGDRLVQLINSHDGGRRNEFVLSPDGSTLTMHATMFSPRLPSSIRYTLTYRRR